MMEFMLGNLWMTMWLLTVKRRLQMLLNAEILGKLSCKNASTDGDALAEKYQYDFWFSNSQVHMRFYRPQKKPSLN